MIRILVCLLGLIAAPLWAADLTVTTADAPLYAKQDVESKVIVTLAKGVVLKPLAQGVGAVTWYMVKTPKGRIGWVQASDVHSGSQTDELFRDKGKMQSPKRYAGSSLGQCLARADSEFEETWSKTCERNGNPADCLLTGFNTDVLKRDHRAAREECIKIHGVTRVETR
jgi:hypothetical protein